MQKKVLIIDDDPDMLKLVKVNLEAKGFKIYATHSGKEGLAIWKKDQPDLILLDVLMPEMDGLSFMREVQSRTDLKNIPIVVLSAKEGIRELFTMDGIVGHVSKPFEYDELLSIINLHLQ
ncbi:MAG: response regulator [Candidatus Omnitrophica bacterium]|nr:response regulator [Candidatus Omnitrophota bacterium]MCB9747415.1 response regulator [Candidatus Omnitrophota bacterium]